VYDLETYEPLLRVRARRAPWCTAARHSHTRTHTYTPFLSVVVSVYVYLCMTLCVYLRACGVQAVLGASAASLFEVAKLVPNLEAFATVRAVSHGAGLLSFSHSRTRSTHTRMYARTYYLTRSPSLPPIGTGRDRIWCASLRPKAVWFRSYVRSPPTRSAWPVRTVSSVCLSVSLSLSLCVGRCASLSLCRHWEAVYHSVLMIWGAGQTRPGRSFVATASGPRRSTHT
jgi:hypothetical protein